MFNSVTVCHWSVKRQSIMDIRAEIQELKELEERYLKLCKVHCNSDKAIKAFHTWYKTMLVLFNRIIPSDNEDFKFVKSQDSSGNGVILNGIYYRISGRYAMLLDDIEHGKYTLDSLSMDKKPLTPMVFISHSSKDKYFAEALVSLLESIGMDNNNVFCSSVNGYGIKPSADIFTTLRNLFKEHELYVFFIHSPNYYDSPVSLNEMGAAWVLKTHFYSFLTPDMNFSDLKGVINGNKLSIKVDSEEASAFLTELKNDLITTFGLAPIDEIKWERKRNQFLQSVRETQHSSNPSKEDTDSEFRKKAVIRAYSVKERSGQRSLHIKNEGDLTVTNLQVDIPNKKEFWASRPNLPKTYEELLPGASRVIILALVEGQNEATIHFTWDDDYHKNNDFRQTIDL